MKSRSTARTSRLQSTRPVHRGAELGSLSPPMRTWITNPKIRIAAFLLGAATVTLLRLSLYDEVQKSPKILHPPLLLFDSFMLFVFINMLFFGLNVIKSLASVRGSHDEQHVREVVEPVFQGHITDDALQRWRLLPYFFSLGIVAASAVILLLFLLRK